MAVEGRLPYSIQWYEGMLLKPQHFQRTEYKLQSLLNSFCSFFSPFCYGVNLLKVDTAAITSSIVRVLKVSGVFQDGLMFDFDCEHDGNLSIDLKQILEQTSEPVTVFLAIAKHKDGISSLSGEWQRFLSEIQTNVCDENEDNKNVDLNVLKPKLRLMLQNEIDARFVSFPLIVVQKSESDGLSISEYIPPTLSLGEHSKLLELIRDLIAKLKNKISFFSDRQGNSSFLLGEEIKQNLKTLIQATLELEAVAKIPGLPPLAYYNALLRSASLAASMNVAQSVPSLPEYKHDDLFSVFQKLCVFVQNSIEFLKQPFVTVPFPKSQNGVFSLNIKKEWLSKEEFVISIKRPFSASDNDLLDWINGVQIASESCMSIIKDRRVLGAERRIVTHGENYTPPSGAVLLAIRSYNPYVHALEDLHLFNPSDQVVIPEEIVLYVDK